jgi:DNA-damage-inducible protein D
MNSQNITLFEQQEVRKKWHKEKWYFSVSDVVQILTDSKDVNQYVKKLRQRDTELSSYWGTICTPLELISKDGKKRKEIENQTGKEVVTKGSNKKLH